MSQWWWWRRHSSIPVIRFTELYTTEAIVLYGNNKNTIKQKSNTSMNAKSRSELFGVDGERIHTRAAVISGGEMRLFSEK